MRCINAKKNVVIFLFVCSVLAFGASMVWAEDPVAQELLFDYSSAITQLTSDIASKQSLIDSITAEITRLQAINDYASVTSSTIDRLMRERALLIKLIADSQSVLNEITNIFNLDASTKDQLYYFYTVLGCTKVDFMMRMPFNYQAALIDPIIVALLADTTNSSESKIDVAKIVYGNYPLSRAHARVLVQLQRYL